MPTPTSVDVDVRGVLETQKHTADWNGVRVTHEQARCSGSVAVRCDSQPGTRLSVLLEETGGNIEPRISLAQPCKGRHVPRPMCLYPASEPVWGYSNQLSGFRMLTLLFDTDDLRRRLPDELAPLATLEPRLRFAEDGIWHLAQLLAEECSSAQRYGALYAESLIVALFSRLVRAAAAPEAVRRGGLSKRQLALALDFIEGHLHQAIGLGELAQLTGLSQSHFCHAFKVSTGLAPHRWQLAARVRRAELLLLERPLSVRDVARALGFADQSHFTRVFRQHTGATPAAWRRDRLH